MLQESPIDGFDISIDDKDMLTWKVTITGLDNTPYAVCPFSHTASNVLGPTVLITRTLQARSHH